MQFRSFFNIYEIDIKCFLVCFSIGLCDWRVIESLECEYLMEVKSIYSFKLKNKHSIRLYEKIFSVNVCSEFLLPV